MPGPGRARSLLDHYTRDVTPADFQRLFTRDTAEAYRYFTRHADARRIESEPWYRRWPMRARLVLSGFTARLSPARRLLYGLGVAAALLGAIMLFRGFAPVHLLFFPFTLILPLPTWSSGAVWPSARSICLRSVMLAWVPVMRVARPLASRAVTLP